MVVATDTKAWIGPASPKSPDSFELLPREVLPPAPIHCVATDGTLVVLAGGPPSRAPENKDDDFPIEGTYQIVVLDLRDYAVRMVHEVDRIGDHVGIVEGHVVSWYWYAQSDVLGFTIPVRLDGGEPRFTTDLADEHFDYCGAFAARGDVIAGTIDYRDKLYVGGLGAEARSVDVPQRFRNPRGFAFLGFDLDGHLVLTIRGLGDGLGGDKHHAWRLEADDTWTDLGEWTVEGDYEVVRSGRAVEFAGPSGRPVRLMASQLPA
ncbi:MAG: hypothetical protein JWM90_2126 [Thermoleophilia bacterium]|nr:hypothetical protein [Thermoleophilia bacterium]